MSQVKYKGHGQGWQQWGCVEQQESVGLCAGCAAQRLRSYIS